MNKAKAKAIALAHYYGAHGRALERASRDGQAVVVQVQEEKLPEFVEICVRRCDRRKG